MRLLRPLSALFSLGLAAAAAASPYDAAVLRDNPAAYLRLGAPATSAVEPDASGHGHQARYYPTTRRPAKTRMPNGDVATVFDGFSQYLEIRSTAAVSVRRNGALTVEAWIRPDVLQFPSQEGDGYVHWLGKGEAGQHEYACRMYSRTNAANRPSRISGYAFNPAGGLGSGSYFQDAVTAGTWIHVAVIVDTRAGDVKIFKNAVLRKTTPLSQFDVTPVPGDAPLRVATRDLRSYFKGAIGKVAVYGRALTEAQLRAHFQRMR